jgi:hypothetical protein
MLAAAHPVKSDQRQRSAFQGAVIPPKVSNKPEKNSQIKRMKLSDKPEGNLTPAGRNSQMAGMHPQR